MSKQYKVYELVNDNEEALLPTDTGLDFWDEYEDNTQSYDRAFDRLFSSFKYFKYIDSLENARTLFKTDVYDYLLLNRKKFEELYRVNVLADTDYSFTSNLDYKKTMSGSKNSNGSYISGQRQDSGSDSIGQQQNTVEGQVAAFDTSSYSPKDKSIENLGAQQNTNSYTKGAQTDTNSNAELTGETVEVKGLNSDKPMSSMIDKHIKLWTPYEFYTYIFKSISKEFLLVGDTEDYNEY